MTGPTRQPSLDRLIARLSSLISAATNALEVDLRRIDDWYDELARQLRRYTLAAYMNGSGDTKLSDDAQQLVADLTHAQLEYLAAFRDEVKAADEWKPGWAVRAQMYAQSIKNPYWSGKTADWPLPAMPGDGTTQCYTNCGCAWDIQELDGDGNADAYWRRSKSDSCQTCVEREAQWGPLRIRDGEL